MCHGTLSLLARIDLLTKQVHASIEDRRRSREFVGFLKKLDAPYPADTAIKPILDNHSAHVSKLKARLLACLDDVNSDSVIHQRTYKIAEAA